MRILVTGSTGFLGKALVPVLLKDGHHITMFTRNSHTSASASFKKYLNNLSSISSQFNVFQNGDLFNQSSIKEALKDIEIVQLIFDTLI